MEIKVTFEDRELVDLAVQHLAEQTQRGDVEEWIWSLVLREVWAQPSYRGCPKCHTAYHPIYQTREAQSPQKKHYRVDLVGAVETCHECGGATVPYSEIYGLDSIAPENAERSRRFLAGMNLDQIFDRKAAS